MPEILPLTPEGSRLLQKGLPILREEAFYRTVALPKPGQWVQAVNSRGRNLCFGIMDELKGPLFRVVAGQGSAKDWPRLARDRVKAAWDLRKQAQLLEKTDVYRLLNGEGDHLPGLLLDRYGEFGVAWAVTPGIRKVGKPVYQALIDLFGLKGIYEKGSPREGFHPDSGQEDTPVLGERAPDGLVVQENGMRLEARLNEGPRTGVYPDQRENRAYLGPRLKGRKVLNTFSYTGAFSVSAALFGAAETVSVDLSKRALDLSVENFRLNGIDPEAHLHVKADVFDYLKLARKRGESFGVAILDPPTFSTSRKGTFRARKDWPRLLQAALAVLDQDGLLALSCNTRHLSEKELRKFLKGAGRPVKVEAVRGLPDDFPAHPLLPQTNYLKFMVVRCL